ncbi:hypothetical protein AGOR_G00208980 [Albula goreensis]|uniref:Tuftelin n=1 Tax=Albula goreensis TaxID=1534307 RepID=A0A8T3CTG7_9TELE|nr:hypothetical protein AGOR_G00208980 [Albula goreensis]
MSGITRSLCTFEDIRADDKAKDNCRRLRLTLHDQNQSLRTAEQPRSKPIGRAFALVQPPSERQPLKIEPIKPTEEKVEIIKVYLGGHRPTPNLKQATTTDQQNLKMQIEDQVSQVQEVRYCLKNLREVMAARSNKGEHKFPTNGYRVNVPGSQSAMSNDNEGGARAEKQNWEDEQESARLREVSKRLYGQLQEAERRHQEEREKLQAESSHYRHQLSEQAERLLRAEEGVETRDNRIDELQRLLSGMEQESAALQEKMKDSEQELLLLRAQKEEGHSETQRSEQLEKEVAILKEKIHHLDDMLKSQQRKVRHMIEQLQNSRTVIQERDRVIRELEEKVAYLQSENRELHDQMDYFLGSQRPSSYQSSEHNQQIVYSKPLRPSNHSNKSLPFIKVIEIKS